MGARRQGRLQSTPGCHQGAHLPAISPPASTGHPSERCAAEQGPAAASLGLPLGEAGTLALTSLSGAATLRALCSGSAGSVFTSVITIAPSGGHRAAPAPLCFPAKGLQGARRAQGCRWGALGPGGYLLLPGAPPSRSAPAGGLGHLPAGGLLALAPSLQCHCLVGALFGHGAWGPALLRASAPWAHWSQALTGSPGQPSLRPRAPSPTLGRCWWRQRAEDPRHWAQGSWGLGHWA